MLAIRFLVVDKNNIVLGGNQRLKACQEAGLKEIHVVKADDLTEAQVKEFIIRDNTYYGEWDNPMLSTLYSDTEMVDIGMDLVEVSCPRLETIGDIEPAIDASDLAQRKETYENNQIKQIVVYFPSDLYEKVIDSINGIKKHMHCEENPQILLKLINYWKANYAD